MTMLDEEEKVREGKNLLEMLWKMGEVRPRWNEAGGAGVVVMSWTRCSIFGLQMKWVGLNRIDEFARMVRLANVGSSKK